MTSAIGSAAPQPRRVRKRWIILGILAVVIVVSLVSAFMMTGGAVTEAERFLEANAAQGPEAAWHQTSPGFRSATTAAGWAALSRSQTLENYAGASWSRRAVSGHQATLEGTVELAEGRRTPIEMTLVDDAAGWQVQSINFTNAGASATPAASSDTVPGDRIAAACRDILAEQTQLKLDAATCPSVAATKGAVAECTATRGSDKGPMRVTIDEVGEGGRLILDCEADLRPAS